MAVFRRGSGFSASTALKCGIRTRLACRCERATEAHDDAAATTENTVISAGSVFIDNGSGPDSDPDNAFSLPAVTESVTDFTLSSVSPEGTQFTLASGALLTVNADGTFSYDPNHLLDYLPAPSQTHNRRVALLKS
jgi:hypothetical protein